jgi:hypothetical protein
MNGRRLRLPFSIAALLAVPLVATACGSEPTPTPALPLVEAIPATIDLGVGENRVSFLLISYAELITASEARVTPFFVSSKTEDLGETIVAPFYLWPFGTRGSYVANINFDQPGNWLLFIEFEDEQGRTRRTSLSLEIAISTVTPALGSKPFIESTKTVRDTDPEGLTSWSTPDLELYQFSLEEVPRSGRPSVVAISSPAYCTSPTCGPQAEAVSELKDKFKNDGVFIHVEVYDNPEEIQGDLTRGIYSELVDTWGLSSLEGYLNESWVFILDRGGSVAFKYEGFASVEEMSKNLQTLL